MLAETIQMDSTTPMDSTGDRGAIEEAVAVVGEAGERGSARAKERRWRRKDETEGNKEENFLLLGRD